MFFEDRAERPDKPILQYNKPSKVNESHLVNKMQNVFAEDATRSKTEQVLYDAWLQSEKTRGNLETMIEKLQCEVSELKKQVNINTNPEEIYMTDEEELARETEWVRVEQRRKKRKFVESPLK